VRLATKDAKFAVAMSRIGLTGGDLGISYFLPRSVGISIASEMMMTCKNYLAPRLHDLGIISHVFDSIEELHNAGHDLCMKILETMAPAALMYTKQVINMSLSFPSLEHSINLEDRQQLLSMKDPDFLIYSVKGFKKSKL